MEGDRQLGAESSAQVFRLVSQQEVWLASLAAALTSNPWDESQGQGLNKSPSVQFRSVQSLSCVQLFVTPWTTAHQASPSITNSWSLLKLMSIESVMPSNYFILWHFLLFLLSIFPSIKVFSIESALVIRRPKYRSFSFSISPSNEYSVLISFRIN